LEVRDVLLWFAHFDLFTPKWSKHIFDEWKSVFARKQITEIEITRRLNIVYKAFPDALVENYESLLRDWNYPTRRIAMF
jgi:hypothetical protein